MNHLVNKKRARKEKDPETRILEHALKEFASHGYAGARMDQIALKARISKRMLFYYFKSKANLFEVVLQDAIQMGRDVEPHGDDAFGKAPFWSSFHMDNPLYARLIGWEGLEFRKSNLPRLQKRRRAMEARLKTLEASFAKWTWPEGVDPFLLMFALISVELAPILLPNLAYTLAGEETKSPAFRRKWASLVQSLTTSITEKGAPKPEQADHS